MKPPYIELGVRGYLTGVITIRLTEDKQYNRVNLYRVRDIEKERDYED